VSRATFGFLPWRSRSQCDHAAKSCPAHNFVIWSRILKIFHRNDHQIETTCCAHYLGRYLEGQGYSMTLQQNRVRPITLLFDVGFRNVFTEMITILRWRVTRRIWDATLKVKVTAWPCSKIVSSQYLCNLKSDFENIHRNDYYIKRRWLAHNLGRYFKGLGHSMTLQQNRVRPVTLLFEVGFQNYFTEMTTTLRRRVMRNI